MRRSLFQFIQIQLEGGQAIGQEPIDLRQLHLVQRPPGLLCGGLKFQVARLELLDTFNMS